MLVTLIAPHVVNVFSITRIMEERDKKRGEEARKRYREKKKEE